MSEHKADELAQIEVDRYPGCTSGAAYRKVAMDSLDRLSRYEAAMREALEALTSPYVPQSHWQDVYSDMKRRSDIAEGKLRTALSDQPAEEPVCEDCDTAPKCHGLGTCAEEPAESKLEAMRGLLESWRCVDHDEEDYNMGVRRCIDDLEAILDAQPISPKPKGKRK